MPGYIDNIPAGYQNKWAVSEILGEPAAINITVDFINPKQVINARFYLDGKPEKGFVFECPLPDVQLIEARLPVNLNNTKGKLFDPNSGSWGNTILSAIILFLFVTFNIWTEQIQRFLFIVSFRSYDADLILLFVFATLVAALVWNVTGLGIFDTWILRHKEVAKLVFVIGLVVCTIGALCVACGAFWGTPLEEIISIGSVIIISLAIHVFMLIKRYIN